MNILKSLSWKMIAASLLCFSMLSQAFAVSPTPICPTSPQPVQPGPVEGMWIPLLMGELNYAEMKQMGLKLSAEDIYSVNQSSLKDAVISFGGFCTGEVVSDQGLIFTNHHCGYSAIQSHSSVENDYLTDGFWAMNRGEELPNPGLTATFIVRIEDVTDAVLEGVTEDMSEGEREAQIAMNSTKVQDEAIANTHYEAKIKEFFYGNEYYMFVTETFKDVRLVGAPPSAIGKFGGDTDNWMFPRHTGDFSVFRIYAGPDNKPAEYSEENKPYRPKHFFPISLKGVNKGDFTMVYGFPGRTQEYLTHQAVEHTMNVANPAKIQIRRVRLDIMTEDMKKSDKVRIQYASKYARVSNYWKKWRGENRGLKKLDAINKKIELEKEFTRWVNKTADRKAEYGEVLPTYDGIYTRMADPSLARDYINEAAFGIEAVAFASRWRSLVTASQSEETDSEDLKKEVEDLKKRAAGHFKNYNAPTDRKMLPAMLKLYKEGVPAKYHFPLLAEIESKYKGDYEAYADKFFKKSILVDEARVNEFLEGYSKKKVKKIEKDPAYILMTQVLDVFFTEVRDEYYGLQDEVTLLNRTYVKGLREMKKDKNFYPDANSTLRIAYGKIDDYEPADGIQYHHYTTIDGIAQKHATGKEDYEVPQRLLDLYKNKDYGPYAANGTLPVCFTASNHTTGGNSGSPCINAEGQLIGINFDRNWEGTMSDIMYDPDRCRNISVDVRYVLWVIDKYAGAGHLIKEMKLIK